LLKLLSGLYTPSSGFVLVQGVAPTGRCDLVYLSQQEHLFAWGTEDNVLLGRAPDVAAEHLRALKLHGLLQTTQDSARLSGGERQGIYVMAPKPSVTTSTIQTWRARSPAQTRVCSLTSPPLPWRPSGGQP
jgi:ABC-type nitrate/sulfonate/bicarbonate transport system ATPase subunit